MMDWESLLGALRAAVPLEWVLAISMTVALVGLFKKQIKFAMACLAIALLLGLLSGQQVLGLVQAGGQLALALVREIGGRLGA